MQHVIKNSIFLAKKVANLQDEEKTEADRIKKSREFQMIWVLSLSRMFI